MSISKLLSLIVAGLYLLIFLLTSLGGELESEGQTLKGLLGVLGFLLMSLACIWFGDELGNWMGTIRLHQITSSSPGCMVRFMGWVFLLLPVILFIIANLL